MSETITLNPITFKGVACTVMPAMMVYAVSKIADKVMEAVAHRFPKIKGGEQFFAFVLTGVVTSLSIDRVSILLFGGNPLLMSMSTLVYFIAIGVLAISTISSIERKPQIQNTVTSSPYLTNLSEKAANGEYVKNPGREEIFTALEAGLNRQADMRSMVLVGDESSQPMLVVEECARRIAQNDLSPNSNLRGKKVYLVNIAALNGELWTKQTGVLDSLGNDGNSLVVIPNIDQLSDKDCRYICQLFDNKIKAGKIVVIGITMASKYRDVQELPFSKQLTPIQLSPIKADECLSMLQSQNQAKVFTQNCPLITITDQALALATMFAFHPIVKGFIVRDAMALMSDIVYELREKAKPFSIDQEQFMQAWKNVYARAHARISLVSLDEPSRKFFTEQQLSVDKIMQEVAEINKAKKVSALAQSDMPSFLTDMNEEARLDKYLPCIGRKMEIDAVIRSLKKPKQKSLVLVGPPGIGKTAIFEEIARRIVVGDPSVEALKGKTFYWVDVNALAGTDGYVGQLQKAVSLLINFAIERGQEAIFVIDEIHTLHGTGAHTKSNNDVFEMLKNALARDQIVICATANDFKWNPIIAKDGALERRLPKIPIAAPTPATCLRMLLHINQGNAYTRQYDPCYVEVTEETITAAIVLTEKWMPKRYLPDKATVVIADAVGYYQTKAEKAGKTPNPPLPVRKLSFEDIAETVFRMVHDDIAFKGKPESGSSTTTLPVAMKKEIFMQQVNTDKEQMKIESDPYEQDEKDLYDQ